jgi:LmbE family N-acetylglucosaminyl deacetylase
MTKKILVIAAHADDEVLGCGGTIAKHVAADDAVYALFMTDGVAARAASSDDEARRRQEAAAAAARILGLKESFQLAFPDNRMDSVPLLDVVLAVEAVVHKVQPDIVYTHHVGDLNVDHRITHQAAMTACRPMPGAPVKEIYTFEVLSSTEWAAPNQKPFLPNVYVDISEFVEVKRRALSAYALEMRDAPHSRNIEHVRGLGEHRGNSVGVAAAEAFEAIRIIR